MKQWFVGICTAAVLATSVAAFAAPAQPAEPAAPPTQAAPKAPEPKPVAVTIEGAVKGYTAKRGEATFTLVASAETAVVAAPQAYMEKIGLKLKDGDKVTVVGLQRQVKDKAVVTASTITVDGQAYTLRDAKGKPAWTMFDVSPVVSLTGTVKGLTIPTAAPVAADGKPAKAPVQLVTFTLVVDGKENKVSVCPVPFYTQSGIAIKDGDAITTNGWQITRGKDITILVSEIKAGDKTFAFRAADGKPAWERAKTAAPEKAPKPVKPAAAA